MRPALSKSRAQSSKWTFTSQIHFLIGAGMPSLARTPGASAFHQRGWLEALHQTYHYRPFVLTSASANAQMKDGIVFCEVKSWITGTRAVSLPFSDHCEPLLQGVQHLPEMVRYLTANGERQGWRFAEIRPLTEPGNMEEVAEPSRSYWFHELDLRPSLEELFRNLHKDSIQRRIRHAESERSLLHERPISGSARKLLQVVTANQKTPGSHPATVRMVSKCNHLPREMTLKSGWQLKMARRLAPF